MKNNKNNKPICISHRLLYSILPPSEMGMENLSILAFKCYVQFPTLLHQLVISLPLPPKKVITKIHQHFSISLS